MAVTKACEKKTASPFICGNPASSSFQGKKFHLFNKFWESTQLWTPWCDDGNVENRFIKNHNVLQGSRPLNRGPQVSSQEKPLIFIWGPYDDWLPRAEAGYAHISLLSRKQVVCGLGTVRQDITVHSGKVETLSIRCGQKWEDRKVGQRWQRRLRSPPTRKVV